MLSLEKEVASDRAAARLRANSRSDGPHQHLGPAMPKHMELVCWADIVAAAIGQAAKEVVIQECMLHMFEQADDDDIASDDATF